MMIYLNESTRLEGRLVTLKVFAELEQSQTEELRLEHELDLNRKKLDHEVVLMDAGNEAARYRAHMRYFYHPRQILERIRGAME